MIARIALLDGETLYEMWAEAIPRPKDWDELHPLGQAPWTALAMKLIDMDAKPYPWLTIRGDGSMSADMEDTTPAEQDRRLIIMQEIRAGRLRPAADQLQGAVDALRDIQDVAFEVNGAPADTQRLETVRDLVTAALYRLQGGSKR